MAARFCDEILALHSGRLIDRASPGDLMQAGRVVATAARSTHDLSPMHGKGLSLHVVFMLLPMLRDVGREQHGRILREQAALVAVGKIRPLLDPARFDLAHAPDAHGHLESGKAVGKVVVEVA